MSKKEEIKNLLKVFNSKYVISLLNHFDESIKKFESGEWEICIQKAGKFVEALIKALADYCKIPIPRGREFKVSKLVEDLRKADLSKYDDTVRLLIPRICVFIYDISSNRGARHDPDEIDPNKMDAIAVVQGISWILAEMTRFSQKGSLAPDQAIELVEELMENKYPMFEEIEGRLYVNKEGLSALDTAMLLLNFKYPNRVNKQYLIDMLIRHNFTRGNSKMAISRLSKFVDEDEGGKLKLRGVGRVKADSILSRK
jgi:HEPN domain-containing protein